MDDQRLRHLVDSALASCSDHGWASSISENLDYYTGDLPEKPEHNYLSGVTSRDVFDTVESDHPSLVRTFLGAHSPLKFNPTTDSQVDIQQAEEKTEYINYIIKNSPNSFKVLSDWMKDGNISYGVLKFEYIEEETVKELKYKGIDESEQALLLEDLENDKNLKEIEVIESEEDDLRQVTFKIKQDKKYYKLINVPPENFRITKGVACLEDAEIVGHEEVLTRSDLIQMGYDEDEVKKLSETELDDKGINDRRFSNEGGDNITTLPEANDDNHSPNDELTVQFMYLKVDYDGDGIAERRRIVKVGTTILDNQQFEIIPYAILSAIPIPNKLIGYGRAEIAKQSQKIQTKLMRSILDNIYQVNNPGFVAHYEEINMQDLLTNRPNRIVRKKKRGLGADALQPLVTPYIGDKALQVTQYVDSKKANSLGIQSSNQGLDSDALYRETATRFQGVQDEQKAKIELVARVYAETGFRQLYEGLAWMVAHYQNEAFEIKVLGKQLSIDPRAWRYEHQVSTTVGLAADDTETVVANMGALLSLLERYQEKGFVLSDQKKIYNVTKMLAEKLGIDDITKVLNDPEVPQQTLLAQNEQLMGLVEQLQAQVQQLQNPLAEAEKIKAQADLVKAQADNEIEIEKLKLETEKFFVDTTRKYDELELKYQTDIPGKGTND